MTDAREKIAEIIERTINVEAHTYEVDALDSADAILSALPSIVREMTKPLEWVEKEVRGPATPGFWIEARSPFGMFEVHEFKGRDGAFLETPFERRMEEVETVSGAISRANYENCEAILKAMGMSK